MNTIFLNYDITYKPEIVQCNNETILLKEYIKLKKINNHKIFEMGPFMNMKMIDIPEEKKTSIRIFINTEKGFTVLYD